MYFKSQLSAENFLVSIILLAVAALAVNAENEASNANSPAAHSATKAKMGSSKPSKPIVSFTNKYCSDCHGAGVQEGGLDLSTLTFELNDAATFGKWQRIFERVESGEMPPKSEARADKEEHQGFLDGLEQQLLAVDNEEVSAKGRVRGRRLTRTEYEHTLHDLLGIDIPLRNLLPEDSVSHRFETVADSQQLSHHLLAVYLDVADLALTNAFDRAFDGDVPYKRFYSPEDLATKRSGNYRGPDLKDGKSISWPIGLQFFGRMYSTRVPEDGWYRIKLQGVHAVNPNENGSVWGTLRSGWCEANAPLLFMIGLVEATQTPRDLVYEAWIQKQHCLELKPNDAELARAPTGAKGGNVSFAGRNLAEDGFSGIAHEGIEIERIYRNADHTEVYKNLFGDSKPDQLTGDAANTALAELVKRFAARAFRRPVSDEVAATYVDIGRSVMQDGDSFVEALRASYRAILCSPRFLTFVESPGALDDYAIASRLSYALWTSMPDRQLLSLAEKAKLREPKTLQRQIQRLLSDPKSSRFVNSFTDQWLKLSLIDFTTPDMQQFNKTFDPVLQESMLQETRAYVREMIQQDLGITHLIDSDFAFVNERLARHYRIAEDGRELASRSNPQLKQSAELLPLAGRGIHKVTLPADATNRGGLLTQAAVLKVTADGTRTSPIVRGVFVNERILGVHIPPPPPGVPAVEPDIRGATSIRDQLDKHRSNESCAACHKTIDPPGFALESYNAIGAWRKRYGVRGDGVAIDTSGETPLGDSFADLTDWKQIYLKRREQLAGCFVEQFLTYATGAPIRFSDHHAVNQIVKDAGKNDFGLQSLIRNSLMSPVFLKK